MWYAMLPPCKLNLNWNECMWSKTILSSCFDKMKSEYVSYALPHSNVIKNSV